MAGFIKKFTYAFHRKGWANGVILNGETVISVLLTSEDAPKQYPIMRIWQAKTEKEQNELRKYVLQETLLPVVKSKNPIVEMRRQIISNYQSLIANRMPLDDEFREERERIYDHLNPNKEERAWSDEECTWIMLYAESTWLILTMLQNKHFEEIGYDYWDGYGNALEHFYRSAFRTILDRPLEDSVLEPFQTQAYLAVLDKVHRDLLDEPFVEGLDLPIKL